MKKFFYKFFIFILVFVFLIFFVGCKKSDFSSEEHQKRFFRVIATIFPYYDFVRQITNGVEGVSVDMLIPPGVDSHSFELNPNVVKNIKNSDLFIYNGGESDVWLEKAIGSLDGINCLAVSNMFLKNDKENKDKFNINDDHFWTSILNSMKIVKNITNKLCKLNPKDADKYEKNMNLYLSNLKKVHENFLDVIKNKKRDVLVFADKFPFTYFVRDYNLKYISPYSSCSSKASVGAFDVSFVVEKIKENHVPVILKLEQESLNLSKVIAEGSGAKVKTFYSCHGCSKEDFEQGKTFLDFVKKNLNTLKEALC